MWALPTLAFVCNEDQIVFRTDGDVIFFIHAVAEEEGGIRILREITDQRAREDDHLNDRQNNLDDKAKHVFLVVDEIVDAV